jgi:methanogenic corrinoid protein MtbC1
MWERRYGFPSPIRNSVGNRIYREADVERLVLVSKAMKMGYRAGEAIRLSTDALTELLATQTQITVERERGPHPDVEPLIDRVATADPEGLRRELRRMASILGARQFIVDVCAPLVEAVGDGWSRGELQVHHEHLLSDILVAQLRLMSSLHDNASGPKLLLATLPREQHGIGLHMVGLFAQVMGAQVQLLGTDTPPLEICRAASALRTQAVGLSLSSCFPTAAAREHIQWLAEHLPGSVELWLGGKGALSVDDLPNRARVLSSWNELELAVHGLVRGI